MQVIPMTPSFCCQLNIQVNLKLSIFLWFFLPTMLKSDSIAFPKLSLCLLLGLV